MANLTAEAIQRLEADPQLFALAMREMVAHLQREAALAERLDAALRESDSAIPSGWIDWSEVLAHFRARADAAYVRDELRRNRRVQVGPGDVTALDPGEPGARDEDDSLPP